VAGAGRRDPAGSVTAPSLVAGGGPESSVPQEKLAEAAALIPSCELVTIPAGHHVHTGEPARFATAVLDWLGG
jgi:3-oxoadipate enol-lactonase